MRVLSKVNVEHILFFDIETVCIEEHLTEDSRYHSAWEYKQRHSKEFDRKGFTEDILDSFSEKAALYPEFAKVAVISIGHVKLSDGVINVTSFYEGCNEKIQTEADIINAFCNSLDAFKAKYGNIYICGHSVKAFDISFLLRRSLILGLELHPLIDTSGVKSWDLHYILDTKELFQGTSFTPPSLIALAAAFGLENPKQDIQGDETSKTYWSGDVVRVARYCERDVVTVANILLRMMRLPIVEKRLNNLDFEGTPLLEKVAKLGKYTKEDARIVLDRYNTFSEYEQNIASLIIQTSFNKTVEELKKELL